MAARYPNPAGLSVVELRNADLASKSVRGDTPIVETATGLQLAHNTSDATLPGHEHEAGAWADYDPVPAMPANLFLERHPRRGSDL